MDADDPGLWWQHQVAIAEHRDATSVQDSNRIILRALVATKLSKPPPRMACLKRFLTHALRYNGAPLDERNRWQRIAYRTEGVLESDVKPTEEHVITNGWFCRVLLDEPERWLDDAELVKLLALQTRCLVTAAEHGELGAGFGWQRYLEPKQVVVHDCRNRPFSALDVRKLAEAQIASVRALGLEPE